MDLFTFFEGAKIEDKKELPLYTEIAWDFEKNIPIFEDGTPKKVTGNEGIKTWCYKALQVPRYKHEIYNWDYGSELEKLIGTPYSRGLTQAECVRYLEECLLVNPYITGITQAKSGFYDGKLFVTCKLNTVYGTGELEGVSVGV